MRTLVLLLGLLAAGVAAWGQSAPRAEILILGSYHMANPGHDIANVQADDVLAPKRQREIAELIAVLKKFQPTKVAIETNPGSKRIQEYADYVAGKHTLSANEIEQVGFRLAKELGHRAVYPVDVDGDFPWYRVRNYAIANGRGAEFDSIQAGLTAGSKALEDFLRTHTILETLQRMNADSSVANDVAVYYHLVRFGDPFEYAGPDLVASWFQRNIRIYRNVVALADSPNERILVVYGAGHLGWLQQNVANDPWVRLRKLGELR